MEKETKIILKWILYSILLTLTCILIFFCLPWIAEKIVGNLGIEDGIKAIFVMFLLFNWTFGMTAGFKFCCDELDELESEEQIEPACDEQTEIKKEISPKEETEIKK